jgi:uncharacterized protein with GYD domain
MALSMIQFSYTSETVGKLLKKPEDRSIAVGKLIEKLGGKLLAFYYSYGDYDGVIIADLPDTASGLATTMVAFAGGGTTKVKTTVLFTVKEAMAAMKKGSGLNLEQPKG